MQDRARATTPSPLGDWPTVLGDQPTVLGDPTVREYTKKVIYNSEIHEASEVRGCETHELRIARYTKLAKSSFSTKEHLAKFKFEFVFKSGCFSSDVTLLCLFWSLTINSSRRLQRVPGTCFAESHNSCETSQLEVHFDSIMPFADANSWSFSLPSSCHSIRFFKVIPFKA